MCSRIPLSLRCCNFLRKTTLCVWAIGYGLQNIGVVEGFWSFSLNWDLLYRPNCPEKRIGNLDKRSFYWFCWLGTRWWYWEATWLEEIDLYFASLVNFFTLAALLDLNMCEYEKWVTAAVGRSVEASLIIAIESPSQVMQLCAWSKMNPIFKTSRPTMKSYLEVVLENVRKCACGFFLVLLVDIWEHSFPVNKNNYWKNNYLEWWLPVVLVIVLAQHLEVRHARWVKDWPWLGMVR